MPRPATTHTVTSLAVRDALRFTEPRYIREVEVVVPAPGTVLHIREGRNAQAPLRATFDCSEATLWRLGDSRVEELFAHEEGSVPAVVNIVIAEPTTPAAQVKAPIETDPARRVELIPLLGVGVASAARQLAARSYREDGSKSQYAVLGEHPDRLRSELVLVVKRGGVEVARRTITDPPWPLDVAEVSATDAIEVQQARR